MKIRLADEFPQNGVAWHVLRGNGDKIVEERLNPPGFGEFAVSGFYSAQKRLCEHLEDAEFVIER